MNATKGIRHGYMTTVFKGNVSFALFAISEEKLREAFIEVTDGRVYFDASQVDRVKIAPIRVKEVAQ